jgi:hypothetical protein
VGRQLLLLEEALRAPRHGRADGRHKHQKHGGPPPERKAISQDARFRLFANCLNCLPARQLAKRQATGKTARIALRRFEPRPRSQLLPNVAIEQFSMRGNLVGNGAWFASEIQDVQDPGLNPSRSTLDERVALD